MLCHQDIEKGQEVVYVQCDTLHSLQRDLEDYFNIFLHYVAMGKRKLGSQNNFIGWHCRL